MSLAKLLNVIILILFTIGAALLLVLEITPGPDMMLVVARGIGQGRRVAILTVVGMIFVAGVVQVGLLVLGVASLLSTYPAGLMLLQWLGAAYMLYLGGRMILASLGGGARRKPAPASVPGWRAVREGAINSLTNPKSLLFMFAFLPQFVASGYPVAAYTFGLAMIHVLIGTVWSSTMIAASRPLSRWLKRPAVVRNMDRLTGLVFVAFAVRLATSKR